MDAHKRNPFEEQEQVITWDLNVPTAKFRSRAISVIMTTDMTIVKTKPQSDSRWIMSRRCWAPIMVGRCVDVSDHHYRSVFERALHFSHTTCSHWLERNQSQSGCRRGTGSNSKVATDVAHISGLLQTYMCSASQRTGISSALH